MRVKTYRGKSTSQVLEQVKRELGPDAVILSNQTLREDGVCFCEIMAAVEKNDEEPEAPETESRANATSPRGAQDEATGWRREWNHIKQALLGLAGERLDLSSLEPRQQQALRCLEEGGVDKQVVIRLYAALTNSGGSLLGKLGEMTPLAAPGDFPQRFQAVSGPAGCGKTTQLIRLASTLRRGGKAKICLANGDTTRSKGRLVLKHFAQLLGCTYRELHSPEDFQNLLAEGRKFDRVLIDLPAVGRDAELAGLLKSLGMTEAPDLAVHLVLSPHFGKAQVAAFLQSYLTDKTRSVIWTKLDEACTFGAILNVCEATGLPVSVLSQGPGLRDAAAPQAHQVLWKLLFKHELPAPRRERQAVA
ncbi:hypothetical protein [Desulfohalovibrio reitneri]|uniref:flagellar biosynthesis protein FlhF n=1 Tax=Desulfohalovibrio reitneri TaxID=1307759 RepID=UPI0004A754E9|nr:hypothetical protein [Desulfohalovibrio reitneri]